MRPTVKRKIKIFSISALVICSGIIILLQNFEENIVFFYTPSEIHKKSIHNQKNIRIGGLVKHKSLHYSNENSLIEFIITDNLNDIRVKYEGLLPSLFREGQGVVAKGDFVNKDLLIANQILAKHDENYMPKEIVDKLKESGQWRDNK